MQLSQKVLKDYAASRSGTHKSIVCHAPFVSLNFEQNGNVRACCYNFKHILGTWPQDSIKDIWRGEKAEELRDYIKNNELGGGCSECGNMIQSGNHAGVRAKFYDEYAPAGISSAVKYLRHNLTGGIGYPKVMEFELSNKCNLECVMCNGYFSSSIRKNREKLPPLESPYNDAFVDELNEFIPHLTDAKFLGGEPFMIDIYLKIWERIRELNPNMRIHITTNGTFLTERVKKLLDGLRAGIIISTDSVSRETYNKIRINGQFDKVMQNIEYFREYAKRKNTFISMAICPITHNWHELPEMLDFCLDKNISLYFNAVFTPVELSLREQPLEKQEEIIAFLKKHPAPPLKGSSRLPRNLSIRAYNDFIKQLEGWIAERKTLLKDKEEKLSNIKAKPANTENIEIPEWSVEAVYKTILALVEMEKTGYFEKEHERQVQLANLLKSSPENQLSNTLLQFVKAYRDYENIERDPAIEAKIENIAEALNKAAEHKEKVLQQMAYAPPFTIAEVFMNKSLSELQMDLQKFDH
ncbi:MAG: twitch domain-containing radical SAM protein [Chitinophagales bacterium]